MPNYFLVSLSNRTNLDLCIRYALAGFTDSANGFWTFLEIDEGDFISFLYGARVWNLYRVKSKVALKDAQDLPPWPHVTFRRSGKTYYFPFRLQLEPVRNLQESLVRPEFAYVAENLLLRGGYGKTHFQADQTTLHAVSQLGDLHAGKIEVLPDKAARFSPLVAFARALVNPPYVYPFSELILQALTKKHLSAPANLSAFLGALGLTHLSAQSMEVLGERALPEGHVDILIKDSTPVGRSSKIAIEVKLGDATISDIDQLGRYVQELGIECEAGVLIVRKVSSKVLSYANTKRLNIFTYDLSVPTEEARLGFSELLSLFRLSPVD